MEARVYAEDPFRNFLPSIGRLHTYKEPPLLNNTVRIDTGKLSLFHNNKSSFLSLDFAGVKEGDEISIYYDPMIAKLVTYGKNRQESIDSLKRALDSYV